MSGIAGCVPAAAGHSFGSTIALLARPLRFASREYVWPMERASMGFLRPPMMSGIWKTDERARPTDRGGACQKPTSGYAAIPYLHMNFS
jgi:hypothetical protein